MMHATTPTRCLQRPMPTLLSIGACSLLLLSASCNRTNDAASASDEASTPEQIAEPEQAAEPEAPAEVTRGPMPENVCEALVDVTWEAYRNALQELQLENPDAFRERFVGDMERNEFVARCETLDPALQACVWGSSNVITGLASCGVNTDREFPARIMPPTLSFYARARNASAPLSDADAQQQLNRIAGTWQREGGSETWTFDATGAGTIARPRGTETQTVPYQLAFTEHRAVRRTNVENNRGQTGPLLWDGDDAFYTSLNTAFGAYPFNPTAANVIDAESEWLLVTMQGETPLCQAIGPFGELIEDVVCEFGDDGVFTATYTTPGDIRGGGPGVERERRYRVVGDDLVHQHMTRYVRAD